MLFNISINYLPLTPDNIQFKFDDFGLLHIKFVNLKPIIKGKKHLTSKIGRYKTSFSAKLNNFIWEQIFVVTNLLLTSNPFAPWASEPNVVLSKPFSVLISNFPFTIA